MCTPLVHFWPLGDQVEEREREKKEKHQSCIQKCVVSGFEVNKPYLHVYSQYWYWAETNL